MAASQTNFAAPSDLLIQDVVVMPKLSMSPEERQAQL
jgi:hypothetical protein